MLPKYQRSSKTDIRALAIQAYEDAAKNNLTENLIQRASEFMSNFSSIDETSRNSVLAYYVMLPVVQRMSMDMVEDATLPLYHDVNWNSVQYAPYRGMLGVSRLLKYCVDLSAAISEYPFVANQSSGHDIENALALVFNNYQDPPKPIVGTRAPENKGGVEIEESRAPGHEVIEDLTEEGNRDYDVDRWGSYAFYEVEKEDDLDLNLNSDKELPWHYLYYATQKLASCLVHVGVVGVAATNTDTTTTQDRLFLSPRPQNPRALSL